VCDHSWPTIGVRLVKSNGSNKLCKWRKRTAASWLLCSSAAGRAGGDTCIRSDLCLVLDPTRASTDAVGAVKMEYLEKTPIDFDIQVYQTLPLYVRSGCSLREGVVLPRRRRPVELAYRTIRAFEDFRPRYQYYLDEVARVGS